MKNKLSWAGPHSSFPLIESESIQWSQMYSPFDTSSTSSIGDRLLLEVIFASWRLSFFRGHFPLEVVFNWRSSSIGGHLPLEVVFLWRLSSIGGRLPLEILFHLRSSCIGGPLSLEVVSWNLNLSPTSGCWDIYIYIIFWSRLLMQAVFLCGSSSFEASIHFDLVPLT